VLLTQSTSGRSSLRLHAALMSSPPPPGGVPRSPIAEGSAGPSSPLHQYPSPGGGGGGGGGGWARGGAPPPPPAGVTHCPHPPTPTPTPTHAASATHAAVDIRVQLLCLAPIRCFDVITAGINIHTQNVIKVGCRKPKKPCTVSTNSVQQASLCSQLLQHTNRGVYTCPVAHSTTAWTPTCSVRTSCLLLLLV
jgi:hypothetical protein